MSTSRPALVVTGPPGSGKTSTGLELARALGAALLDLDSVTNPLVDVVVDVLGGEGYDDPRVTALVRSARYESLLAGAEDCLRAGVPVVLVAPFTQERADQGAWAALAGRITAAGGEPRLLFLTVSREELSRRLLRRGAGRDAAKLADLGSHVASVDLSPPTSPHLAVDAALAPVAQAGAVLRELGRHTCPAPGRRPCGD